MDRCVCGWVCIVCVVHVCTRCGVSLCGRPAWYTFACIYLCVCVSIFVSSVYICIRVRQFKVWCCVRQGVSHLILN